VTGGRKWDLVQIVVCVEFILDLLTCAPYYALALCECMTCTLM